MNPIPVRVWSAAHDTALLPKTLDDAEQITDDLLWGENDQPNPNYQAFAAEMLAWMQENEIPMLGALAALHSDLLRARQSKKVALYIEYFPRDHGELFHQFVSVARQHDLIVHDSAGPTLFLPDGNCMPAEANQNLNMLAHLYRKMQQYRKPTEIPTQMQQVPEWLQLQVNAYFSEYGFSDCVIQVDDDGALIGRAWKKTPAGLMILSVFVYERYGSLRVWGYVKFFLRDLFTIKKYVEEAVFNKKYTEKLAQDFYLGITEFKKDPDVLDVFFQEAKRIFNGYIRSFTDIKSFFDFSYENWHKDVSRTMDINFFVRACMVLYPQKINEFKNIILNYEKIRRPHFSQDQNYLARVVTDFEEQCRVIKDYGVPTIAADPAFYAEDLGVEDLILKGYKLI